MNSRILAALVACAGLVGCNDESDDNHGYGYEYDYESVQGIKIRCDMDAACPTGDQADKALLAAGMCLGVSSAEHAAGLMVIGTNDIPNNEIGMYFPGDDLAVVSAITPEFNQTEVIAHEFVHHLLYKIARDADEHHQNDCFSGFTLARYVISAGMAGQ